MNIFSVKSHLGKKPVSTLNFSLNATSLKQLEEATLCTRMPIKAVEESAVRKTEPKDDQEHWHRYINQTAVPLPKRDCKDNRFWFIQCIETKKQVFANQELQR